jgi:hypothetical protein
MTKQFQNIESLRAERLRLESLCKEKETELQQHLEYVQEHFGSLLLRSLLPFSKEQKDKVGGIFDKVHAFIDRFSPGEDSKLKPVLKIVQMIVAGLAYKFIKKKIFR